MYFTGGIGRLKLVDGAPLIPLEGTGEDDCVAFGGGEGRAASTTETDLAGERPYWAVCANAGGETVELAGALARYG